MLDRCSLYRLDIDSTRVYVACRYGLQESKEQLQDQIRHLEARAALLRQEQGLEDPKVTESKLALHADLREAVLHQDLIIANTQSAISGFVVRTCCVYLSALVAPNRYVETRLPSIQNSRATSPLETYIHLTRDWNQRREALLAMKEKKIETAHRFLMERTRHMDPLKKCCEVSQFESDDGDFYTVKVDVTPFEGVKSVRQVFESLLFYFLNVEISITEISGNVTVRENTDDSEKTVLHHRLVTCEPSGILVEKNSVLFLDQSGLDAENVDEQYVLITSDFVDQDDLYPYCPRERLRKDGTTAIKLSAHWRKRPQREGTLTESVEDELVVVLTRWHLFRLRRPEMDVPKDAVHAISDDMSRSVDIMLRSTKEGLYPTAVVQ